MPRGPAGGPRPASNSSLLLIIRETPVVGDQPEGVFPEKIIRTGADEEEIISDIVDRTTLQEKDISIDISNSFKRGLGQTDEYKISVDVSGLHPDSVNSAVDELVNAGYLFDLVQFE